MADNFSQTGTFSTSNWKDYDKKINAWRGPRVTFTDPFAGPPVVTVADNDASVAQGAQVAADGVDATGFSPLIIGPQSTTVNTDLSYVATGPRPTPGVSVTITYVKSVTLKVGKLTVKTGTLMFESGVLTAST